MIALASSFLIGSFIVSSNMDKHSLKFCRIRPRTYELPALEHLENPHRLIMGEML